MHNNGEMLGYFANISKWKLNRCLAPSNDCTQEAIGAHSVQNARVMDILSVAGHVKAPKQQLRAGKMFIGFEDIGRNRASVFEGFCSKHDTEIFLPIDTEPFRWDSPEHLFLYAYRSIAKETHAVMEAGVKSQLSYQKRVQIGLDTGNEPEPAGMTAIAYMMNAYATFEYKEQLDKAFLERNFALLLHETVLVKHSRPSVAVSACFSLDDESNDESLARITINCFPLDPDRSAVIFSYTEDDSLRAKAVLTPLLSADGDYQKYLLSKLILMRCENFVVSPSVYETWSDEKKQAVTSFFIETLYENKDRDDSNLYLFE